ncbi:unnamed protein product [Effrenium voratum]|nr:unnamed protein product [Effrenium voratum]
MLSCVRVAPRLDSACQQLTLWHASMWSGGGKTTTTQQALTLYVTNIPEKTSVADLTDLFSKDEGFCGLRAVGGRMAFVDYGSEIQATTAMRRHQGHRFDETDGLTIDFDHDKRSKRSRAIERPWAASSFRKRERKTAKAPRKSSRERETEMFQRERSRAHSQGTEAVVVAKVPKPRPPSYLKALQTKPKPQRHSLVAYSSSEDEEQEAEASERSDKMRFRGS